MTSFALIDAFGATDPGRVREQNDDAFALSIEQRLLLLADGMGGHSGGGIASRLVVETLQPALERRFAPDDSFHDPERVKSVLDTLLRSLSDDVRRSSEGKAGLAGMGATVVLALVRERRAVVANMGDSRAYRVRGTSIERLTRDHTVATVLAEAGEISAADVATHGLRHMLSRYVGMADAAGPDVELVELEEGDRILLCSDGLTGEVDERAIHAIVAEANSSADACKKLIDAANRSGGHDNITVVLATIGV